MKVSLRFVLTCCLLVTVLTGSGYLVLLQFDQKANQHTGSIIIHRFKRSRPTSDAAIERRRRRRPSDRLKATTYRPPSPLIRALQFDKIDIYEHYEASVQTTSAAPPSTETLTNEEEEKALYLTALHFQDHQSEANQEADSRSTAIPNIIPAEWQEEASDNKPFEPNDVIWAPHLTQPPSPVSTTPWPTVFTRDIHFEKPKEPDHYKPKKNSGTIARKYKHRARYGGYGPPPYQHGGGYHHQPVIVHPPPIIVNDKDKGVLKGFLLVFLIPIAIALALFVLFTLAIGYAYTLAYVATILNSTNITYIYGLSGLTGFSGLSILPFITSLTSGSFAFAGTTQQQQQQQSSNNNNNNNNANNNNNNNAIVINVTGRANRDDEMLIFKNPFKFEKFQAGEEGELTDD